MTTVSANRSELSGELGVNAPSASLVDAQKGEVTSMKAVKFALAAILASGGVLSAQEEGTPRYEVGLNYSWLHVNSANEDRQRTGNGGSGSFAYNINNVVGLVADFGGYANTRIDDRPVTYMIGPRFSWRHTRLTPYVQV